MKTFLLAVSLLATGNIIAQDTIRLDLSQAEKLFLQKNLMVLAAGFQIEAAQAQVIQARIWENPNFLIDVNALDPQNNKLFHVGGSGQKAISFDQLIYLGGKKKKEIAIAQANVAAAKYELEDLLRNIKNNLRISFYNSYFDKLTIDKYDRQIQELQNIISAYEEQAKKGNISLKEAVRLKATQLQLYNERSDLKKSISQEQITLQTLLGTNNVVVPQLTGYEPSLSSTKLVLDTLITIALQLRPDMKLTENNLLGNNLAIGYEKSKAVPDLRLGASYDQRSGAFNNQVNLTAGIGLPFWNRNQGNIRAAEKNAQSSTLLLQQKKLEITAEVQASYQNLLQAEKEYQRVNESFWKQFEDLNEGVFLNFRKQNISLLEFTDFIESYNQMITEYNRIQKNRVTAYETINYVVSKDLF